MATQLPLHTASASSPRPFHWRALTSVLLSLAFLMLALSGVILFVSPPGRVANWTNWTLLGLRKSDWSGLHIWFSAVFLAMTTLHLFFNLRPLLSYLRDRLTHRYTLRREWVVAAAACFVIAGGTLAKLPPFTSLLAWNESLKESWDQPAERAPIPHAELLSLAALAEKAGVDLPSATARLRDAGIAAVPPDASVQSIADRARLSAQQIYTLIRTSSSGEAGHAAGKSGGGTGWKTLQQYCADEGLDFAAARARLLAKGITADDQITLRELAARSGQKPYDLVAIIRAQK